MAVHTRQQEHLLELVEQDGRLVVTRRSGPFRKRYVWGTLATAAVLVILIGYLWVARLVMPGFLVFVVMAFVVLLAIADRSYNIRRWAGGDDVIVIDRANDQVLKNDAEFAPLSKAQQVMVRHVRDRDADQGEGGDYVLLLVFEDRKLRVAEGLGIPTAREEILAAATEIADYAGLQLEESSRMDSEWWMDV